MDIENVLKEIQSWLFLNGIEGVAQGENDLEPCITVFISNREIETIIPSTHKGFKVVIEYTDEFNIQTLP